MREAKKYKCLQDFRFFAAGAFRAALKNGWIDDYPWLRVNVKWTKDKCMEIALKYHTRTEMHRKNNAAYMAAYRHGWLDDYWWFMDWDSVKDEWGEAMSEAIKVYVEKGLEACREEYRKKSEDKDTDENLRKLYKYMADAMTDKWFSWCRLKWRHYYPLMQWRKNERKSK